MVQNCVIYSILKLFRRKGDCNEADLKAKQNVTKQIRCHFTSVTKPKILKINYNTIKNRNYLRSQNTSFLIFYPTNKVFTFHLHVKMTKAWSYSWNITKYTKYLHNVVLKLALLHFKIKYTLQFVQRFTLNNITRGNFYMFVYNDLDLI